jgi:hypothetical protein
MEERPSREDVLRLREEARQMSAALADEIPRMLEETAARGSRLWWNFYYVIKELGDEAAVRDLVRCALERQAEGGMTVLDGSRKRTLGGIFFAMAKEKLGVRRMGIARERALLRPILWLFEVTAEYQRQYQPEISLPDPAGEAAVAQPELAPTVPKPPPSRPAAEDASSPAGAAVRSKRPRRTGPIPPVEIFVRRKS